MDQIRGFSIMNKWIFLAWVIFLGFIGSIFYLAQRVPERIDDDSIVKQYKIEVNESALVSAKDERTPPEAETKKEEAEAITQVSVPAPAVATDTVAEENKKVEEISVNKVQ